MKKETLEFCVDKYGRGAVVKSVNLMQRAHWSKWTKIKKQFTVMCTNEMRLHGIKGATERDKFVLIITSYRSRLLDEDNLVASHKWLIDGLRSDWCKFIWDDDPAHMSLQVRQVKATKATGEKPRTVVERYS